MHTLYGFILNDVRNFQPIIIPKPRLDNAIDLVLGHDIGGDFVDYQR